MRRRRAPRPEEIKELVDFMGWNQTQFGAMCGVTQQTAGRWLVGSSEMKAEIWEWLRAEIFKDLLKQERWPPPSADELIRLLAERDG